MKYDIEAMRRKVREALSIRRDRDITPDEAIAIDGIYDWYEQQERALPYRREMMREVALVTAGRLTEYEKRQIGNYHLDRVTAQLLYGITDSDWEGFLYGTGHQAGSYREEILPAAQYLVDDSDFEFEPQYVPRLLEIHEKTGLQCNYEQLLQIVRCEARYNTFAGGNSIAAGSPEELYVIFRDNYYLDEMLKEEDSRVVQIKARVIWERDEKPEYDRQLALRQQQALENPPPKQHLPPPVPTQTKDGEGGEDDMMDEIAAMIANFEG